MKKILITLTFLFTLFSLNATNYYINDGTLNSDDVYTTAVGNNTNDGVNGKSPSKPMLTFRGLWTAFGPFADGDIIYVDAGTYVSSAAVGFTNYGYTITKNITIQGVSNTKTIFSNNGIAISGTTNFADISGTSGVGCIIKNIQFTKYGSSTDGQCFTVGNSVVTFDKVLLNSNGGSTMYGALSINSNSTVTITGGGLNCNGNASYPASGGIDVKGTNITVNVTNTSFIGNYKASAAQVGNGASLSITGTSNSTTDVNYTNCLFSGSYLAHSSSNGGTIYMTGGDLTLTDCIIDDSDMLSGGGGARYGGAFYATGGTAVFTRVKVSNCNTTGSSCYGTVSVNGGALTLTNCYFTGNTSDRGNDIYCKTGSISATNTTFGSTDVGSVKKVAKNYGVGSTTLVSCGSPTTQDGAGGGSYSCDNVAAPSFTTPTVPTYTGTCATAVVLPIELVYFIGDPHINYNKLYWLTASEQNNDYFNIYRSVDGVYFDNIFTIKGGGDSRTSLYYEVIDRNFDPVINYYILRQTDYDGRWKESDIISVDNRAESAPLLLKVTNLLGQEVNDDATGVLLYHYSDGTILKRIH